MAVVHLDGQLLADSRKPVVLFETGLPMWPYLPREDVRLDLLTESDTVTRCPYKSTTTGYWSFGDRADSLGAMSGRSRRSVRSPGGQRFTRRST